MLTELGLQHEAPDDHGYATGLWWGRCRAMPRPCDHVFSTLKVLKSGSLATSYGGTGSRNLLRAWVSTPSL